MLKTIEGAVKFMSGAIRREFQSTLFNKLAAIAALPALKGLKGKLDPRKFNGAILLGLRGIVIKSHGGTDEVGFRYALEEAYHEAKSAGLAQIEQGVATQLAALEAAKAAAELEETATPATELKADIHRPSETSKCSDGLFLSLITGFILNIGNFPIFVLQYPTI